METGVDAGLITARSQNRRVCRARYAAMDALRDLGMSLQQIGKRLGGRDHATVSRGLLRHAELMGELA